VKDLEKAACQDEGLSRAAIALTADKLKKALEEFLRASNDIGQEMGIIRRR